MKTILFISNGHGEDDIAGKIIDRLRRMDLPALKIDAWPMVGRGEAYGPRGILPVGTPNVLPGAGFGTLNLRLFWRDLRAGWFSTYLRQMRAARGLRGRYALVVAVGDIVVIAAALLARTPFLFVGSAKSAYYSGTHRYNRLEKALLRRSCRLAFPRDAGTAAEMERAGIRNRFVGNPMMDDLEGTGETFNIPPTATVVGLLPGSRADMHENALTLLAVAAAAAGQPGLATPLHFLFAAPSGMDPDEILRHVGEGRRAPGWRRAPLLPDDPARGIVLNLAHARGPAAGVVKGKFADVLRRSQVVIGLAGTANEQAVGLGKPLITFPGLIQGPQFVRMKMRLFDAAAIAVAPRPEVVARALVNLLRDPVTQARMSRAGRERMGPPGASDAIAEAVRAALLQAEGPA